MVIENLPARNGQCEVCDKENVQVTTHYGNMKFCADCWALEITAQAENRTPEQQATRVEAYQSSMESRVLETSQQIDASIVVKTDLFNAATTAILDIKKAIEENPEISNKPYALAEVLTERFNHYKQVVFDAQQVVIDAGNNQKAIQVYLNQLANSLRAEEREKLKIADINYKPLAVKPTVKKVSTSQTNKKSKIDQKELRKYAAELGVAMTTLQMIVVSKGISVAEAATFLKSLQANITTKTE